jgi:uncharacterized protein YggU (UPF0235/DUF167 family)
MDVFARLSAELWEAGEITLSVKVTPKSRTTALAGQLPGGVLRIKVAAAPEKGRANAELCAFLARQLGVSRSSVSVVSGHSSPTKRISVVRP